MRFRKSELSKPDMIYTQGRDGQYSILKRPSLPIFYPKLNDPNVLTCMWCPETQECGHPLDPNTFCGPKLPDGSSGGFVSQQGCIDTKLNNRDRYDEEEREANKALRHMNPDERKEFYLQESKVSQFDSSEEAREKADLSEADAEKLCMGRCIKSGYSSCAGTLLRVHQTAPTQQGPGSRIQPGTMGPCKLFVTEDLTFRRVVGRYSLDDRAWKDCSLIPCQPAIPG
jgi:hypothetical protein